MRHPPQLKLYPLFNENRDKLNDPAWLAEALQPHCHIRWMRSVWGRSTRLRMIQFPREIAAFLILMAQEKVRSYLEIGTSCGGTFYTVDSYLRCAVPGYERALGYDHHFKMREWDQYKALWPRTEFRHESSKHMRLGKLRFDMAFVDARHIKHWVLRDWNKVRGNSRLVAFHDIGLATSTVGEAWNEIKAGRRHVEIFDPEIPVEKRCGIGVVWSD